MSLFNGSQTRSAAARNHALITPESHVPAILPGWAQTQAVILIAPRIGAKFAEYFVQLAAGATSALPPTDVQRFVFVLEGVLTCVVNNQTLTLSAGSYVYLPPNTPHQFHATADARAVIIEKRYVPVAGAPPPHLVSGIAAEQPSRALGGDPDLQVTPLLPDTPSFDMAMNIMAFAPGAALGLVEVHVMEHGLLMLSGQAIYRLDDRWYPVQQGDVIYMAPFCPQWCAAFGKTRTAYLLYKDWNRDPFGY